MKRKVLVLCDDPTKTSGVGCQARHLIEGLVKTGHWSFRCLGGAIRHENYDVKVINDDFIVKPVDGFGTPELLRNCLVTEKPDAVFLFTDPRFFTWVWEMEDEVHQICPIVYWHVWDNDPFPRFNDVLYRSTDLINCHSHLTYTLLKDEYPDKVNFVPHAIPQDMFFPITREEAMQQRVRLIGADRRDHFVCIWVNRNARRKMPGNVMLAWKLFLDKLEQEHGHRDATLVMHTHPHDPEGQNLPVIAEQLEIGRNVVYSAERVNFSDMNVLYNVADFALNIAAHEGFGMATLEAMQCGLPIIALKTGGLTRQVIDHRDGSANGFALEPEVRDLVGGQTVPYIYEDHISPATVAASIMSMYELGSTGRNELGSKARAYVLSEFDHATTVALWDKTMGDAIDTWKRSDIKDAGRKQWEVVTL